MKNSEHYDIIKKSCHLILKNVVGESSGNSMNRISSLNKCLESIMLCYIYIYKCSVMETSRSMFLNLWVATHLGGQMTLLQESHNR